MPTRDSTTSPLTLTSKVPFRGRASCGLYRTLGASPPISPLSTSSSFLTLRLNTPHDLHASIATSPFSEALSCSEFTSSGSDFFADFLAADVDFFVDFLAAAAVDFLAAAVDFFAAAEDFLASAADFLVTDFLASSSFASSFDSSCWMPGMAPLALSLLEAFSASIACSCACSSAESGFASFSARWGSERVSPGRFRARVERRSTRGASDSFSLIAIRDLWL